MTDVNDVVTAVTDAVKTATDKVDQAKAVATPQVEKAVGWRDRYLNWVSRHPKTVSVVLAVAVVWAVLASIKV